MAPQLCKMRTHKVCGRGIYANVDIAPGKVLHSSDPFVYALREECVDSHCHHCFKLIVDESKSKSCSACEKVRYCSEACSSKAAPAHHLECELFQSLGKKRNLTPTMLLMLRWWFKSGQKTSPCATAKMLSDHGTKIMDDSKKSKEFALIIDGMAHIIRSHLLDASKCNDSAEFDRIHSLLSSYLFKISTNVFSITNDDLDVIGIGLYPGAALFNHSCAPNAVAVFEGTNLIVRSIQNIKTDESICISYIDLDSGPIDRRKKLRDSYFFDCVCNRCGSLTKISADAAINSEADNQYAAYSGSSKLCVRDQDLKKVWNTTHKQLAKDIQQYAQHAYLDRLDGCRRSPKSQEATNTFHEKFQQLRSFQLELIDKQLFESALECAKMLQSSFEFVYGPCHPVTAQNLHVIVKLMTHTIDAQSNIPEACALTQKCVTATNIARGEDHPLAKEVLGKLMELKSVAGKY